MVYVTDQPNFNPTATVISCAIIYNRQILFLLRSPEKPEGGKWGVPGGKLEKTETITEGLIRETFEETGIHLNPSLVRYFKKYWVDTKGTHFEYHLYYYNIRSIPAVLLSKEHTDYQWVVAENVLNINLVSDMDFVMKEFISNVIDL
jgi:8-oxo-dGTP diphosphatase